MKKYFIITIDTEGDGQWVAGNKQTTTLNARYIPRFQSLCEKYAFVPTYLTNYEMINDDFFVEYIKGCIDRNSCEIGMHLHAWNSPPDFDLEEINEFGHYYLIQYPKEIMREKIRCLTDLIEQRIGIRPTSHRAGRWMINEEYLRLLTEFGYKVDCSITPHVNWKKAINDSNALNFEKEKENSQIHKFDSGSIVEIPMTIKKMRVLKSFSKSVNFKKRIKNALNFIRGTNIWLRPSIQTFDEMRRVVDKAVKNDEPYIMFMIHSSELMAGGSPYYSTCDDIESLYDTLEKLFDYITQKHFKGVSLSDYADICKESYT